MPTLHCDTTWSMTSPQYRKSVASANWIRGLVDTPPLKVDDVVLTNDRKYE
jgi:hypothetical protein